MNVHNSYYGSTRANNANIGINTSNDCHNIVNNEDNSSKDTVLVLVLVLVLCVILVLVSR